MASLVNISIILVVVRFHHRNARKRGFEGTVGVTSGLPVARYLAFVRIRSTKNIVR